MRPEQHYGTQTWMVARNGEEDLEKGNFPYAEFWRNVREELETSMRVWLRFVTEKGGLTLKKGLDNKENTEEQDEWVVNNVRKSVDDLGQMPYF
jgi:hypothetical protein